LHETEEERGIAHFIEHMGFNGSENFAPGEIVEYFGSIGVDFGPDINAYTTFDRTVYSVEVPVDQEEFLVKGLTALYDYGAGMLFLPEEVEKEKGIILEELRLGRDVSMRVFEQEINILLKDSLYPDRLPIGLEETVSNFTSEDFKRFYGKWYRPDLMTLVVAGDYDPYELEKQIKKIFSKIPAAEEVTPELLVPFVPHDEMFSGVITDPEMEESYVYISYLRDPSSGKTLEDLKRGIANSLIFKMLNKRFNEEEYKTDTPLIYSSAYHSDSVTSMEEIGVWASVKPSKSVEALEVVSGYIEGFRNYGFSNVEREEVETHILESLRKSKAEAETYESYVFLGKMVDSVIQDSPYIPPEDTYDLVLKLLPTISDEYILERIEYLFNPHNMSVILEVPERDSKDVKEDVIKPIIDQVMADGGLSYELEALDYSYDYSNIPSAGMISREYYEELDLTVVRFSNGLTVLLKPTEFDKDTVILNYTSLGGKLLQDPGKPGSYAVASSAWKNGGTEDLSQFEVDRLLKSKNISLGMGGSIFYWIYGTSSRNEIETLCQWMWQYLERPGYSEEGIEYAIKAAQESIRSSSQYQESLMYEALRKLLLPNNPLSVYATEEDVANYKDRNELKKLQDLSFVPSNCELTVLGAFDLEEAISLVSKYFGSLTTGEFTQIPYSYLEAEFPQGKTERIIYKGLEEKCQGQVLFPTCMYEDEDRPAMELLGHILDARYTETIREEKSFVYSIGAGNTCSLSIKGYGYFYAYFGTDPDKVSEVIDAVMEEVSDIKVNGPEEDELVSAKKIILSDYEEVLETNEFWLSELEGVTLLDYDLDNILKYEEKYSSVTIENIREVAKKYLDAKNNLILIGLPEETDTDDGSLLEVEAD